MGGADEQGINEVQVSEKRLPAAGRARGTNRSYNKVRHPIYREVGMLKTVLLIMRRASLAQGLMAKVVL